MQSGPTYALRTESKLLNQTMKDTLDLFRDHPAPKPATMLELVAMPGIKLSPTQRAFKQLVQKIEAIEQQLKEIAGLADVFRPLFDKTLQPLQEQQDKVNREMVLFLDAQLQRKGWTANQRATMREIVCQTAELLIGSAFDEEAKTIFDRHSDSPVAELTAALEAEIEEMFGGTSGKGGDEPRSPEEMFNDAMRMLEEGEEQAAREVEARAAAKRGGKQSARQQKAAQQALDAGKLLKEIYRKLTSVLHPAPAARLFAGGRIACRHALRRHAPPRPALPVLRLLPASASRR